jgi:hypothetical protein
VIQPPSVFEEHRTTTHVDARVEHAFARFALSSRASAFVRATDSVTAYKLGCEQLHHAEHPSRAIGTAPRWVPSGLNVPNSQKQIERDVRLHVRDERLRNRSMLRWRCVRRAHCEHTHDDQNIDRHIEISTQARS